MRKFGLFLCLSLLFAFTGCSDSDDVEEQGGTVLAKPSVAVTTTTSSSFKVAWDAVPNAESYKYRLSQENETGDELVVQPENSTSATALAFGDLDPKTKYILRVKAVAAAGSGLTDSEYSKIFATTLAEEAAELTFEKIAATNPTYESVDVEIVPSAENLYYWQVVENSLIEGKSDREIVAALKENISELSSGTVRKTVHGLKADTEYTVVAFGYDLDAGKSTSAVARLETAFTTPADDRMTIAITVGTVTAENAHVTFAPSTANADYFADVVVAADIAGKTEMEIVRAAQELLDAEPERLEDRVILLWGRDWHPGVIGIVASRLVEKTGRPVIVVSVDEHGEGKGSGRSVQGFNLHECIASCADILLRFGGHAMAAGLSVREEDLPTLRQRLNDWAARECPVLRTPPLECDLSVHDFTGS